MPMLTFECGQCGARFADLGRFIDHLAARHHRPQLTRPDIPSRAWREKIAAAQRDRRRRLPWGHPERERERERLAARRREERALRQREREEERRAG